jgi:hypothetical protein
MDDDTGDDEPMSAEEAARHEEEEIERAWEAEATQFFGPPAERRSKNQEYVTELYSRYTEPVIRSLLVALSRLDCPQSARDLAEFDLMTVDLSDVVQPYELFGIHFEVTEVQGGEFTVEVSRGYNTAGDGGRLVLERCGEEFRLVRVLEIWLY